MCLSFSFKVIETCAIFLLTVPYNYAIIIANSYIHFFSYTDQASASNAGEVGKMAEKFANQGWAFAQRQDNTLSRIPKSPGRRHFSTSAPQNATSRHFSTTAPSIDLITGVVSNFPPRLQQLYREVREFVSEEVLPIERELLEHQSSTERWTPHPKMEQLKVQFGIP